MKKYLFVFVAAAILLTFSFKENKNDAPSSLVVTNPADVAALFPKSEKEIEVMAKNAGRKATKKCKKLLAIPAKKRTFENTILAYDEADAALSSVSDIFKTLGFFHPDGAIRKKAQEARANLHAHVKNLDYKVYKAFKEYQENRGKKERLNKERRYYLSETLKKFKREGYALKDDMKIEFANCQRAIAALIKQFQENIAEDATVLTFTKQELAGVSDECIKTLQTEGGAYIIPLNQTTCSHIMRTCTKESTRKTFFHAYFGRAYPANLDILNEIITKRNRFARLLGYKNFAEYDIEPAMAGSPAKVEAFLDELQKQVCSNDVLLQDLPDSVTLSPDGKIKMWDHLYVVHHHEKERTNLDQIALSEYFPVDNTVQGLLGVFSKFLGLSFKEVSHRAFWDPDVKLLEVREENTLIGYIILDLYHRDNKYRQAITQSIIQPKSVDGGKSYKPAVTVVGACFSKSQNLMHNQVVTLFHEFGHALHAILGRAEMPTMAGCSTKLDFVEAPSQLLEEWMWEPAILKLVSFHHKTGKPLPDEMIDSLVATRDAGCNDAIDIFISKAVLKFYTEGQTKSLEDIIKPLHESIQSNLAYDPKYRFYCLYDQIVNYGASYYAYPWSKKLARDMFAYIKSHDGLLDPAIGKRYITKVIGKGAKLDPNLLVQDFLSEE